MQQYAWIQHIYSEKILVLSLEFWNLFFIWLKECYNIFEFKKFKYLNIC